MVVEGSFGSQVIPRGVFGKQVRIYQRIRRIYSLLSRFERLMLALSTHVLMQNTKPLNPDDMKVCSTLSMTLTTGNSLLGAPLRPIFCLLETAGELPSIAQRMG